MFTNGISKKDFLGILYYSWRLLDKTTYGIDLKNYWKNTMATLTKKDLLEFVELVKRMREAQKDVIYKSMFSALDSARPTAYEVAKTKQIVLEQEVDEYLKKMEV